jgi:meiotically up-regulated gene 157 (Mug157) protein
MSIQQDFEKLLKSLEEPKVEYLLVGGYAAAFQKTSCSQSREADSRERAPVIGLTQWT